METIVFILGWLIVVLFALVIIGVAAKFIFVLFMAKQFKKELKKLDKEFF